MLDPGDSVGRTHRNEPAGLRLGIPLYADPDTHPELWAGVERAPAEMMGAVYELDDDSPPTNAEGTIDSTEDGAAPQEAASPGAGLTELPSPDRADIAHDRRPRRST